MSDLHPHWQSTTQPSAEPSAVSKESNVTAKEGKSISRFPAAFVGIAIVCVVSLGFFKGVQNITAQLVNEVTVRITVDGFEPEDIFVLPGESIAWINETTSPAIVESETICNTDEICMYSAVLFEGDTWRYDVPDNLPTGVEHIYTLATGDLTGTITTGNEAVVPAETEPTPSDPTPSDIDPIVEEDFVPPEADPSIGPDVTTPNPTENIDVLALLDAIENANEEIADLAPVTDDSIVGPEVTLPIFAIPKSSEGPLTIMDESDPIEPMAATNIPSGTIPSNPYTVGSNFIQRSIPIDGTMNANGFRGSAPPIATHKPFSQPSTGAGTWMIVLSLLCAFVFLFSRKHAKAVSQL